MAEIPRGLTDWRDSLTMPSSSLMSRSCGALISRDSSPSSTRRLRHYPLDRSDRGQRGTTAGRVNTTISPVLPDVKTSDASQYAVVSDKTIFVSSRKLPPQTIITESDERGVAAVPANFPFSLIGVMSTKDKKIAVIKRTDSPETMSLQVGQSLDSWKIENIKNNRVILQSGDTRQSLALADDKKNGAAKQ